ncbi:class I SAM-dependent methyltransferase [Nocardia sp. NPDC051929]|uniref:class I SAM-dependent methyltransferase n=1 Tax=unclassified Nocardia TaxID=2637762 RepID=UPI0034377D49
MTGSAAWKRIWDNRHLDPAAGSTLAQLMAADGLDSAFSGMQPSAWTSFVQRTAKRLNLAPGMSVFDVGCGAGAFLYDLDIMGCRVGGIDQSASLIDIARAAFPRGDFAVADAIDLDSAAQVDVVVSCGVFLYFPSLDYAHHVITAMAAKARHGVAILDIPDVVKADAAHRFRVEAAGGRAAYLSRYQGLDHLYYRREWIHSELAKAGLTNIEVDDQTIDGYGNAPYRFNAIAFQPRSHIPAA